MTFLEFVDRHIFFSGVVVFLCTEAVVRIAVAVMLALAAAKS